MSEIFYEEYKRIIQTISNELERFDEYLYNYFSVHNVSKEQITPIIKEFLLNKGKRIRPAIIFLFVKAICNEIKEIDYNIAIINELIHNATLIHDDIIDCSMIRRGEKTLNFDYDSKLAVLAGDYLLAKSITILNNIKNDKIQTLHSNTVSALINGELFQYFNRFKLLTIDDYIEKSKNKTAKLFEAGIVSSCIAHQKEEFIENTRNFALNFGIAFQIHNDLKNINNAQKTSEDIKNGDYSAPIIFYAQENNIEMIKNENKLLKDIKNSNAIENTKALIKEYTNKAIENLSFIEDNLYKEALIDLCKLYTRS